MDGADEADFLELLVANNRIGEWVERLRARGNSARQKQALLLLKQAVERRSAYAEEARQAGVVPLLTRLLGLTGPPEDPVLAEDEEVLDAASAIIAACSGPMATAGKVSTYMYDGAQVRIREGALGDGLGAKVWMVAHMLCLELGSNRGLVAGKRVLELGSGCGVCGLAAAALGAAQVVLTDVEGPVLRNLRACMHLNNGASASSNSSSKNNISANGSAVAGGQQQQQQQEEEEGAPMAVPTDEELFDEAEEVEDFDAMLCDMVGGTAAEGPRAAACGQWTSASQQHEPASALGCSGVGCTGTSGRSGKGEEERSWDAGNTSVRLLDWAESLRLLDSSGVEGEEAGSGGGGGGDTVTAAELGADLPPSVPAEERFPVIIGSEVMYERVHAELVAAVVRHRLAPGGCAVLHCAVREIKVFEHFARECRRRGLRYRHRHVDPQAAFASASGAATAGGCCPFEGILGRADEYEGGFLLMALDHAESPCAEWYRDDWGLPAQ